VTASDIVKEKRDEILAIARKHGASNVRLFGSVARGDADEQSDIATGHHVDVVTERGLRERIHDTVLREAIAL
jgi:uncharacterized protein